MSFVNLCHAVPGKLNRKKVSIDLSTKVDNVRKEAAALVGKPKEEIIILYQSKTLKDGENLSACGIKSGGLLMAIHKLTSVPTTTPTPVKISDEEVKRFQVAFGSAIRNPSFRRVVKRLLQRDNMETLAAACPGLAEDLSAQAFLTRPELLIHLLDPETLKKVGEAHPSLCEAANNLAAAVHEEQVSGSTPSQPQETQGGSYFLDEMSDEEMEEDDGPAGVQRARSFSAITPEQLAAALANASGSNGGGNPFLGVTGMGPAALGASRAATTPNTRPTSAATTPGARVTMDMFQAAMQQAMGLASQGAASPSMGGPPPPAQPMQQGGGEEDMAAQVARMREMGIVADEGVAVRALQVMGGDLQAAVDLLLSGWLGDDESAN